MTTPLAAYAADKGAQTARSAARDAGRARVPTGDRQYQGVILAEFVVAVLIVALAPLARGKAAQDTSSGPSPYGVDDIKQLAGIGAVYFVLALLSSGKHGRVAAWFGALVLVAIGFSETTSGGLPAIFGIFQPSARSAGTAGGGGQLASVPLGFLPDNGPLPTPTGAPTFGESVTSGGAVSSVAFTQPGVVVNDQGTIQVNP